MGIPDIKNVYETKDLVSACCKAALEVKWSNPGVSEDDQVTCWYRCTKCGKDCDPVYKNKK